MSWLQHFICIHSVLKYAGMFSQVANIQEASALVMRYHIKSEIIGRWLYCFTSPLIGFQLESIGFWYSFKHCAYIYTGFPKEGPADDESLDEIRARLGSQEVNGALYVQP
jgi:hypothetical protein